LQKGTYVKKKEKRERGGPPARHRAFVQEKGGRGGIRTVSEKRERGKKVTRGRRERGKGNFMGRGRETPKHGASNSKYGREGWADHRVMEREGGGGLKKGGAGQTKLVLERGGM